MHITYNSSLGIEALTELNSYHCGIAFLPHSSEYQNFYWDPHQSTVTHSSVRHSSSRVCIEGTEAMSTGGGEVNEESGRAGWKWTFLIASKPDINVLNGSDARMCWTAHTHVTIPNCICLEHWKNRHTRLIEPIFRIVRICIVSAYFYSIELT